LETASASINWFYYPARLPKFIHHASPVFMKRTSRYILFASLVSIHWWSIPVVSGQVAARVESIFPEETVVYGNVSYANDTLKRHLLDVYVPAKAKANTPLLVWIHGGAWNHNDKYADMGYMKNTIRTLLGSGYALASIDYRYSTDAVFPAQIQDCNQALEYLYQHAEKYRLDKNRIMLMGFSAGGHLASLVGLSNNSKHTKFYSDEKQPSFKIKGVIDFYGPSDLIALIGKGDSGLERQDHPVHQLLGASPVERPDVAREASPVTYVDRNDPPFLIIQGELDESVPAAQSKLLSSWLQLHGVKNELVIVPKAPHFGEMFDAENIRQKVMAFVKTTMGE
jgi:acetyl esterase/lipase